MGSERRTRWTNEHGADGLRDKFHVYAAKDAHSAIDDLSKSAVEYDRDKRLGATGEFVFVLRPESDEQAWQALSHYATAVRKRSPQLAADIHAQLKRIAKVQSDA